MSLLFMGVQMLRRGSLHFSSHSMSSSSTTYSTKSSGVFSATAKESSAARSFYNVILTLFEVRVASL